MDFSTVSDSELSAVQHALLATRFGRQDRDEDAWATARVVEMHIEVVEELRRRVSASGDTGRTADFERWLDWSGHEPEQASMARWLAGDPVWLSLPPEDRPAYLKRLIRPFLADDVTLRHFAHRVTLSVERS
ncbi:MAG: hypothetical protein QG622_1549 [Actinomycetota bacterium]|nr:hypothetical protein [Actinomycetota bacterium]